MIEDPINSEEWVTESEQAMKAGWDELVAEYTAKGYDLPSEDVIKFTKLGYQAGWVDGSEYHIEKITTVIEKIGK